MKGDFRDHLVGRDFLIGALAGASFQVIGFMPRVPELLSASVVATVGGKPANQLPGMGFGPWWET